MEKVFTKLLGKWWVIYRGRDVAQEILKQVYTDAKAYLRRVVSVECALMDLETKKLTRSKSMPSMRVNSV
jgi:hypothetical protein